MENRFGVKDFFLFALMLALIVVVLLAMTQFDRQYQQVITIKQQNGKRETVWWPQFRIIDTATVTPDPEVAAVVAKFEADFAREMDAPLGTTAVALDSRNATVRTREAAIGNLIADILYAVVDPRIRYAKS